MSEICLAEQLRISKQEWEHTAKQIRFMLRLRRERNIGEDDFTNIFEEWVTIAKRLNKGGKMIIQVAALPKDNPEHQRKTVALLNLYVYLTNLLGFYDEFFRLTLPKEEHQRLQSAILELLG